MRIKNLAPVFGILACVILFVSAGNGNSPMTKTTDGTYVVNTTTLCNAKGFKGATPVEVYIKGGKVLKVVPLANQESPGYFAKVKNSLLPLFSGLKIKDAKKQAQASSVDGCTGATYSTKATQKNISVALEYYEKHK